MGFINSPTSLFAGLCSAVLAVWQYAGCTLFDLSLLNGWCFWQQEPVWLVCPGYKWCLAPPAGYRHCRLLITGENPLQHHSDMLAVSVNHKVKVHLWTGAVALCTGDEKWTACPFAWRVTFDLQNIVDMFCCNWNYDCLDSRIFCFCLEHLWVLCPFWH